jgi:Protein of unknown function VcgC/VcgE (DUF2780)
MSTQKIRKVITAVIFGTIISASPSLSAAGLTDLLVSQVGVSPTQAQGGAGSIFKLAKSQLSAENFSKLKKAVPAMDKYLAAAPAVTSAPPAAAAVAPASGTGKLADAASKVLSNSGQLGGVGNKLATIQHLAPAFEALGLKSKMVGKFVPVVVDYVKSTGGLSTAKLLSGALGF